MLRNHSEFCLKLNRAQKVKMKIKKTKKNNKKTTTKKKNPQKKQQQQQKKKKTTNIVFTNYHKELIVPAVMVTK